MDRGALIKIYDPLVSFSTIIKDLKEYKINKDACHLCSDINECINSVELVAILTDTSAYMDLGKDLIIFDGRGINKEANYTIGK